MPPVCLSREPAPETCSGIRLGQGRTIGSSGFKHRRQNPNMPQMYLRHAHPDLANVDDNAPRHLARHEIGRRLRYLAQPDCGSERIQFGNVQV